MPISKTEKKQKRSKTKINWLEYPYDLEKENVLQSRKLVSADRAILNDFVDNEYDTLKILYRSENKNDSKDIKLDGWLSSTNEALKKVKNKFSSSITKYFGPSWFKKMGKSVSSFSRKSWDSFIESALGINYNTPEKWRKEFIDDYVTRNTNLITKLSDEVYQQVDSTVKLAIQHNLPKKALRDMLISQTDLQPLYKDVPGFTDNVSSIRKLENRAALIAEDQIEKFNSQLNEQRQLSNGIRGYRWNTQRDRKVRGNPNGKYPNSKFNHWEREGKYYLWHESKKVPEGYNQPPPDGHPGIPVRCRGIGQPDLRWIKIDEFGDITESSL